MSVDRDFLRMCREASAYVAMYAERNMSGHAPVFHREFLAAIQKQELRAQSKETK